MIGVNLEIARTHLLAKKRQTLVAMMGVTFGIGMYLLMISFMNGFNEYLEDTLLSSTPDIHIYNDIKTDYTHSILDQVSDTTRMLNIVHHPKPKDVTPNIRNPKQIVSDIKTFDNILAVSPQLSSQVFYNNGPVQLPGSLNGVNIMEEAKLTNLQDKMKTGAIEDLMKVDNGILLGHGLATKLNASVGDLVTLASPQGTSMSFRVVGTFQFGIGSLDNVRSYVSLKNVQQLLGKDNQYVTDINIKMKDYTKAKELAAVFARKYGYKADDWQVANASAMVSIAIRNMMTIVISFTLLVVAGFGIYNIMNMTIQNKLKDIAILKAEGFAGGDIIQIFLFQSLTIGLFGALLGLILGYAMSYGVWSLPFPKNEYMSITHFPVTFHVRHYVFGVVFGMLTTLIAGLMPSLKAGKIDPVAILRG
ncbi:MAG: ABC transporter permease [Bacteroidetes bacterium]|nr:ABC transporter permease [Bacteroidota bacterium]MBS1683675.1 ABC transporter permease [Bacteroidota bacterium]